jgi:hypothetical protein
VEEEVLEARVGHWEDFAGEKKADRLKMKRENVNVCVSEEKGSFEMILGLLEAKLIPGLRALNET